MRKLIIVFSVFITVSICADGNPELNKKLLDFTEQNNIYEVRNMIRSGVDVNTMSIDMETPLIIACRKNYADLIVYFAFNNADINFADGHGKTALMYAIENCELYLVKMLISKNANVNSLDHNNANSLVYALEKDRKDLYAYLIQQGADYNIIFRRGIYHTILSYASMKNDVKMVEMLIAEGVDVNMQANNEKTPVMFAASRGNSEIVKLLLDKGAKTEYNYKVESNTGGYSVYSANLLDEAVYSNNFETIDIVLSYSKELKEDSLWKMLVKAVKAKKINIARYLIPKQKDLNRLIDDETLLWIACRNGDIEMIKLLLENNADLNYKSKRTNLLAHIEFSNLAWSQKKEVFELILSRLDKKEKNNKRMINAVLFRYTSGRNKNIEKMKTFLSDETDFNYPDEIIKIYLLDEDVHEILFPKVTDINARNEKGETALMKASSWEKYVITYSDYDLDVPIEEGELVPAFDEYDIEALLEQGADINASDNRGNTPLIYAVLSGRPEMVETMLENGAEINVKNKDGDDPVSAAEKLEDNYEKEKILDILSDYKNRNWMNE